MPLAAGLAGARREAESRDRSRVGYLILSDLSRHLWGNRSLILSSHSNGYFAIRGRGDRGGRADLPKLIFINHSAAGSRVMCAVLGAMVLKNITF